MMRGQIVGWTGGVLWMSAVIAMAAPLDCTVEWQRRIALDAAVAGSVSAVKVILSQRRSEERSVGKECRSRWSTQRKRYWQLRWQITTKR